MTQQDQIVQPEAVFGLWTVVHYAGQKRWVCRCKCGTERPVLTRALKTRRSQSCGCASGKQKRTARVALTQHGMTGTPTWISWIGMIQRCSDPNQRSYKDYGGNGVSVCERWLDFANFYADMGERPAGTTIDRENGAKIYGPDTCRWADKTTQIRTRSNTVRLTYGDKTLPLAEWAEQRGIRPNTVTMRLRRGWPVWKALEFDEPDGTTGFVAELSLR